MPLSFLFSPVGPGPVIRGRSVGKVTIYGKKIDEILALDADAWEKRAPHFEVEDKEISDGFSAQGLSHYAIKYNRFMGVISDYFTAEEN